MSTPLTTAWRLASSAPPSRARSAASARCRRTAVASLDEPEAPAMEHASHPSQTLPARRGSVPQVGAYRSRRAVYDYSMNPSRPLDREEYVEQAYFFRVLRDRLEAGVTQETLEHIHQEILATTRLPFAIQFLTGEVKHSG